MEQLMTLVCGLMAVVTVLAAPGHGGGLFGTDSRPCVGDSHTGTQRTDWI